MSSTPVQKTASQLCRERPWANQTLLVSKLAVPCLHFHGASIGPDCKQENCIPDSAPRQAQRERSLFCCRHCRQHCRTLDETKLCLL